MVKNHSLPKKQIKIRNIKTRADIQVPKLRPAGFRFACRTPTPLYMCRLAYNLDDTLKIK